MGQFWDSAVNNPQCALAGTEDGLVERTEIVLQGRRQLTDIEKAERAENLFHAGVF